MKVFYDYKKKTKPSFSYGVFAIDAHFTSTSYLIEIINKKKALSINSVLNVTIAMGLNKKETTYFETMVDYSKAKTDKNKNILYKRLIDQRGGAPGTLIGSEQFEFYSEWYHTVIRELVTMKSFNGDFKQLGKRVKPSISLAKAQASVKLLLKLGFLQKLSGGKYRQANSTLHTDNELTSYAIFDYQHACMRLASDALNNLSRKVRDISTITAGLSEKGFNLYKKEIQEFRGRLAKIADDDKGLDRVDIEVVDDDEKGKYLRTDPDETTENNLDNLPDC